MDDRVQQKEEKAEKVKEEYLMEVYLHYTLIIIGSILCSGTVYHFIHTWYKDREWRRNNPDEHEILDRKIKDDFSK